MKKYIEVNWRDLYGNKFSTKLHFSMLKPEGYKRLRNGKTKDQDKFDPNKKTLLVTFDKDYVVSYLILKIVIPLRLNKAKLLELVEVAWDTYNDLIEDSLL